MIAKEWITPKIKKYETSSNNGTRYKQLSPMQSIKTSIKEPISYRNTTTNGIQRLPVLSPPKIQPRGLNEGIYGGAGGTSVKSGNGYAGYTSPDGIGPGWGVALQNGGMSNYIPGGTTQNVSMPTGGQTQSAAKIVSYYTPNGTATGYIIGGKTYKDPAGTQEIDVGSIVPTNGGVYRKTANGSELVNAVPGVYYNSDAQKTGYNIGGMMFEDREGTKRIPYGSTVTTKDGKTWKTTPNGSVLLHSGQPGSTVKVQVGNQMVNGMNVNGMTLIPGKNGYERPPIGSTVYTNDGSYVMTEFGGFPSYSAIFNKYSQREKDILRDYANVAREQTQARIDASVARELLKIKDQRYNVEEANRRANQQAYQAYLQVSNPYGPIAQRTSAIGLDNSGYAESSQVALNNTYQSNLQQNELQKQQMMAKLDQAVRDAVLSGDLENAKAYLSLSEQVMNMGMQSEQAKLGAYMQALGYENQSSLDRAHNELEKTRLAQDAANNEANRNLERESISERQKQFSREWAQNWINLGMDFQPWLVEATGLPESQIRRMIEAAKKVRNMN